MDKNNLHYFTFFPNSEKPIKAVIHYFPDMPAENISNSFEGLGICVISVRQVTATQRAPNEQIHMDSSHFSLLP